MADEKKSSIFVENVSVLMNPENFQKYILGSKKNGQPRAVYDVVKDVTGINKSKKKHKKKNKNKKHSISSINFYTESKKHKKRKKHKKHWYYDI